jgi:hypothetical protein
MAYCAVPAILRASRMAVRGTERLTDANADRKEQGNVRVSDLLFNRVHPAICGDFVDCPRSTRASLRQTVPAIVPRQRFVWP